MRLMVLLDICLKNSATVPVLQREGRLRYGLSLGRYRSSIGQEKARPQNFFKVQLPGG